MQSLAGSNEVAKLEPLILSELKPDEQLIWFGKEHYYIELMREIFTFGIVSSGSVFVRHLSDSSRFAKPFWWQNLKLIALIIGIGWLIVEMLKLQFGHAHFIHDLRTHGQITQAYDNQFADHHFWILALFFVIPLAIWRIFFCGRVFVLTNKRLICVSLFNKKISWWTKLDKLDSVTIYNGKNRQDLQLTFEQSPPDKFKKLRPFKYYVLLMGIDQAEKVKSLVESQIANA